MNQNTRKQNRTLRNQNRLQTHTHTDTDSSDIAYCTAQARTEKVYFPPWKNVLFIDLTIELYSRFDFGFRNVKRVRTISPPNFRRDPGINISINWIAFRTNLSN